MSVLATEPGWHPPPPPQGTTSLLMSPLAGQVILTCRGAAGIWGGQPCDLAASRTSSALATNPRQNGLSWWGTLTAF